MKQLKRKGKDGICDLNSDRMGVYVYRYKNNKAFICIAKIFQCKESDQIRIEHRELVPGEVASKNTQNYIRLNANLISKLIKLLQEFQGEEVEVASKSGKEEGYIEELIKKLM